MPLRPFELRSDTIAMIGMAETSRDKAQWDNKDIEIWGLNESYAAPIKVGKDKGEPYMRRWDRWFQIHPRWDWLRTGNFNHPNHPWWITNTIGTCMICGGHGKNGKAVCKDCKGTGSYDPAFHRRGEMDYPFPVYTINPEEDVPGSVPYPLAEIVESYGPNADVTRYFTNTFGLMVALALHIGVGKGLKRIEAYGWEMSSKTEYGEQKPNANFWAGIAIGKGVEFYLPDGCSLLGAADQLYGFEKVPGITKMHMEIQVNALEKAFQTAQAELNQLRGIKQQLLARGKITKGMSPAGQQAIQKELTDAMNKEFQKISELNSLFGALQQTKKIASEVAMHSTLADLGYVDAAGNRQKISMAEYERQARAELEEMVGGGDTAGLEILGKGENPYVEEV